MPSPQPALHDLPTTFDAVVEEIVRFSGLPRAEVEQRVWAEAIETGWNVLQDVRRFGVTPYHYDAAMERLYAEGEGFIFDSLVYWARPARQRWVVHALERIRRHAERAGTAVQDLRVLTFGDGPGNDSIFLALNGVRVDFHEVPGSRTYDFAVRRMRHRGLWQQAVRPLSTPPADLGPVYDVVLSFEVLEHLPDPVAAIRELSGLLKPGGLALLTEDFGDLAPHLPTHLRSTARYLGRTPFLCLRHGLLLTWYSRDELFKPCEFTRVERVPRGSWWSLWRDREVRGHRLSRHAGRAARFVSKLPYLALPWRRP